MDVSAAMETRSELPPLQHTGLQPFLEASIQPPYMQHPNQNHITGQNYDRNTNNDFIPPPPPPPATSEPFPPPPAMPDFIPPPPAAAMPMPPSLPQDPSQPPNVTTEQAATQNATSQERRSDSDDGTGSEHSDSEDEPEPERDSFQWQPIEEDKSVPCEDEMAVIAQRGEHSALDYHYWEKKAYFNVDDPEIVPGACGRIDWLVEHFNGTKENPNKEYMMRSPVVRIGDYDWRIKLYPRGNGTDFISAYIECVTMQSDEYEESEDFVNPPLPFISGMEKQKKRRSIAAQLQIVMYNPAEPRVYEYHHDAHQFTKGIPDYGWTRFTRYSRRDFAFRMHGQRQAILRNDQLAFSAYIRIMHDPTSCMWSHSLNQFDDSISLIGLRPFSPQMPLFAAQLPLLHFAPFRNFISRSSDTKITFWFNTLLWKCLSRKRSEFYGEPDECVDSDTIAWLRYAVKWLKKETDAALIDQLVGSLDPDQGAAICGNRLKTSQAKSIQAAVDAHPTALETPALLTLELERHEYQRKKRKWQKLTNKVEMEDKITVSGTPYTLFAFATHCGDLESNKYNVSIRPHGPTSTWIQYSEGQVKRLTRKQCVGKYSGIEERSDSEKEKYRHSSRPDPWAGFRLDDRIEVAHVVMYVRDDFAPATFASSVEEHWDVPENVKKGIPPTFDGVAGEPPATAVYERFGESVSDDPQPPPVEEEPPRRSSFAIDAGYATPSCWQMDGEDVIMSDASEASSNGNENQHESSEEQLTTHIIDHMGRAYYYGQMLRHKYHGEGHLIAMNGDEYKGTFKDGLKSGRGAMTYSSTGNIYDGEWEDDEHHGQGTLTEFTTGNVFDGGWKNGKKHGQFVLKGTVTEEDKGCCSICYDKEITTAFYDCGHVIACRDCANKINDCPVCRKRVLARLELFGVKLTFE